MRHVFYVRIQLKHLQVFEQGHLPVLTFVIGFAHVLLLDNSTLGQATSLIPIRSHCFVHLTSRPELHASVVVGDCWLLVLQSHVELITLGNSPLRHMGVIEALHGSEVNIMRFTRV